METHMGHDAPLNPPRQALRIAKVSAKTGVSKTHIYRLIKEGAFPKPAKISERISIWDESALDDWLIRKFEGAVK
jgi:prophage regulatory protein